MRFFLIIMAVLILLQPAQGQADDPASISSLIRDLGSQDFATRNHAEEKLMSYPRTILPALEKQSDTDDPEVRDRVKRIIHHIKWSPLKIPCSVWFLEKESARLWYEPKAEWRRSAIATVEHLYNKEKTPAVGNYESVAQSFVPMTTNITAIELEIYPMGEYDAWFRVDLCADRSGGPDSYILSRAWIRADSAFPTGQYMLMPFDIPDVTVTSNKTYWIVFTGVTGPTSRASNPFPAMFSGQDKRNGGQCLVLSSGKIEPRGDSLHFRILSSCPKIPLLRAASKSEEKAVPDTSAVDARWSGGK